MAQTFSSIHGLPAEQESVSNVTATNSVDIGTVRFFNGEEYVYVYNAGADQISKGQVAVLSLNSGFSVTASSTTGYDIAFGVCKHSTITTGAYGWLITRGFTTVTNGMASTALAAADPLFLATGGKAQNLNVSTTALCGQVGLIGIPAFGYVVSACGSGGTGTSQCLAYVRCWGS